MMYTEKTLVEAFTLLARFLGGSVSTEQFPAVLGIAKKIQEVPTFDGEEFYPTDLPTSVAKAEYDGTMEVFPADIPAQTEKIYASEKPALKSSVKEGDYSVPITLHFNGGGHSKAEKMFVKVDECTAWKLEGLKFTVDYNNKMNEYNRTLVVYKNGTRINSLPEYLYGTKYWGIKRKDTGTWIDNEFDYSRANFPVALQPAPLQF